MVKCPICGKKSQSYSLITGKLDVCGHSLLSKKEQRKNRRLLQALNTTLSLYGSTKEKEA